MTKTNNELGDHIGALIQCRLSRGHGSVECTPVRSSYFWEKSLGFFLLPLFVLLWLFFLCHFYWTISVLCELVCWGIHKRTDTLLPCWKVAYLSHMVYNSVSTWRSYRSLWTCLQSFKRRWYISLADRQDGFLIKSLLKNKKKGHGIHCQLVGWQNAPIY